MFITRNGTGDMVVQNLEDYERQQAVIDLLTEQIASLSHIPERCSHPRDAALSLKGYLRRILVGQGHGGPVNAI